MKNNTNNAITTFFSAIIICLLFSLNLSGQTINYNHFSKQVDRLLNEHVKQTTPGAAVIVTEKGKPIFKECYGLANLEHNIPVTPTTVFNLASVAKQFTAFSILLLENEGKVNLEDDIHKYLPKLPDYDHKVTVQHLLNHTSGIWEYLNVLSNFAGNSYLDYFTLDYAFKMLKHQDRLLFEPGSEWSYCNANYVLLTQIVFNITGDSFRSWTQSNIFQPLGMKNSFFHETSFQVIKNRATPYRKNNNGDFIVGSSGRYNYAGSSDLYTTIEDMVLWMDNFRTKKLGGDEVVDKTFQKSKLNNGSESFYGYGLGKHNKHGKTVINHSGQTGGYKAYMLYCPENEVGITILSNKRSFNVEGIGNKIFALYLGIELEKKKKEKTQTEKKVDFTIDSSRVGDYSGMFLIEGDSSNLAFCNIGENTFYGIFEGLGQDSFYPISETEFTNNRNPSVNFTFIPNENKKLNRLKLDLKGDIMWANRIVFERLSPFQLSEIYSGKYFSDALGTVYEIDMKNEHIVLCHRKYDDRLFQQVGNDEFASGYGIMRFKRNEHDQIIGFDILDEFFNYNPIYFQKIKD